MPELLEAVRLANWSKFVSSYRARPENFSEPQASDYRPRAGQPWPVSSWGQSRQPGSQGVPALSGGPQRPRVRGTGTAVVPCIWKDQQVPLGNGSWGSRGGF